MLGRLVLGLVCLGTYGLGVAVGNFIGSRRRKTLDANEAMKKMAGDEALLRLAKIAYLDLGDRVKIEGPYETNAGRVLVSQWRLSATGSIKDGQLAVSVNTVEDAIYIYGVNVWFGREIGSGKILIIDPGMIITPV